MSSLRIITTADGSHSLLNEKLNETYHSTHGAIQESMHVFIRSGLQYWIGHNDSKRLSVLEIGFGTGLNAWLTMRHAQENDLSMNYVSIEAFPLEREIWETLNYAEGSGTQELFNELHRSAWAEAHEIVAGFTVTKVRTRLEDLTPEADQFDVIYYDAFAPSKQPEMWSIEMLDKVVKTMRDRGILVTYCAKGQLKRDLKTLGLISGNPTRSAR